MKPRKFALVALAAIGLSACSSHGRRRGRRSQYYTAVPVRNISVGNGSMVVTPPRPWNKQRRLFFDDIPWVESWTLNGPLLDDMTFVTALPDRKALVRQRSTDDRQVPIFRSEHERSRSHLDAGKRLPGARRGDRLQDAVAGAAAVHGLARLPVRLRASRQRRAVAQGPRRRRDHQRPALPDHARCRALALLSRRAARLRSACRLGARPRR